MKKIMLGVLVVIPIIIMLIVGLVTSFVSTQAYIGIESVTIDEDAVQILFSEVPYDENGRKVIDLDDWLTVTVLPERANDKTVEWQIEGEVEHSNSEVSGAALIDSNYNEVESNSDGLMELTDYCTFRVSVSAGEGFTDSAIIEVTDADVQSITLSGQNELRTGDKTMLSPVYTPAGSLVSQGRWASDNESVAVVDANGVVTAVGAGTANITMSAYRNSAGEWVESAAFTVAVGAGASLYGDTVHTASRTVDLAAAGVADASAAEGGVIENGVFTIDEGASSATVSSPSGEVTFIVCEADDFVIENAEFFAYNESDPDSFTLGIGEIPLDLNAVYAADTGGATGAVDAEWSSSNEAVATVDADGVVTAVSEGDVTVTAAFGGKTQSVTLRVVEKISIFRLALDNSSFEVGLARETVFASYRFDPNVDMSQQSVYNSGTEHFVNNVFEVEISLPSPPADDADKAAFYEDFVFTTDNADIAYFEAGSNVLVFNAENITERTEVTLTVSARYPRNAAVGSQSLTLTVIPAIEVNDVNEFFVAARSTQTFTKLYNTETTWHVLEPREQVYDGDIVLGSDIAYCDENGTPLLTALDVTAPEYRYNNYEAMICCSLYGNNHRIYAVRSFMTQYGGCLVIVRAEGAVVSNITISPNNDVGDEIGAASDAQGIKGYAIQFRTDNIATDYVNEDLTECRLEYSVIQNSGTGIGLHGVDFTLDGCIVRNAGGTGIYVPTRMDNATDRNVYYSILRTHNVVMSNLIGTGASFDFSGYSDGDKKEAADEAAAAGRVSTIYQTGFLDLYNWQDVNALNLIDKSSIPEAFGSIIDMAMTYLGNQLGNPQFSHIVKNYNGISYVHFGFVSTGFREKSYVEPHGEYFEEGGRLTELSTDMVEGLDTLLDNPIRVWCYLSSETDIQPGSTYTVNTRFIDRLHQA